MGKENVLPFSRDEINPNLGINPEWKKDLFGRLGKEERVYEEILKGYYLLIAKIADQVKDYGNLPMPPDEKICVGMSELWEAANWISARDIPEEKINGVIYSFVFRGIIRAVNYGHSEKGQMPEIVSYDEIQSDVDDRTFLETYNDRHDLSESMNLVLEQLSILQFLNAVARAYRTKNGNSHGERNVEIFVRCFTNRYCYRQGERVHGLSDKAIAKTYGLRRQRVQQIYSEVLSVALADFGVKQHLAEMLDVTLERVEEKI